MIDYKKTMIKIIGLVTIVVATIVALIFAGFFWPFLIGAIIAVMLERVINAISKRTKINRKLIGGILVGIVYAILGLLVYLIVSKLIKEAIGLSANLPKIYDYVVAEYNVLYQKYINIVQNLPQVITTKMYSFGLDMLGNLSLVVGNIVNKIINFVMFIPNIMIYIIITFLATLFLVTDRRKITRSVGDIVPKAFLDKIIKIIKSIIGSLGSYLKAQGIIIFITFIELLISFCILRLPYPFTLAMMISVIDALPILGTGTVIIPWAIYSAFTGNIYLAIGLIITYGVITIVRQLVEPKIVSAKLGVHPFLTLISMYIAFKIFGVFGLILGPIFMVILKNVFMHLFEAGYFKSFVEYKKKEE